MARLRTTMTPDRLRPSDAILEGGTGRRLVVARLERERTPGGRTFATVIAPDASTERLELAAGTELEVELRGLT